MAKYLVRNLAFKQGKSATFMPKPIYAEPGSGMHLHQYLAKDGVSLFGAAGRPGMLSQLAHYYIGGILEHAPGLCALTNPSTNSYKRLVPGFEAPVEVFFSFANRTAAIRIPAYVTSARRMAIEYRIPDATANPYLALAAVFMAGRDGVKRKLSPGMPLKGRVASDGDYGGRRLPTSLARALEELRRDTEFLGAEGVFSAETLAKWVELKTVEVDAVAKRPHPWEFSLYYGC
uniref:GS catalytic domain-containing protein n=1 Tax=candidate division WOR-3 bacterium TaxID=2052148 RepID=A0A7C4GAS6_UNCW3